MSDGNAITLVSVALVIGFIFGIIFLLDRRDEKQKGAFLKVTTLTKKERAAAKAAAYAAKRTAAKAPNQERPPPQSAQTIRLHHRLFQVAKWAIGSAITVIGFVYGIWGPPWPTAPIFSPSGSSFASPFDVPFTVTNKSSLFSISNLKISCKFYHVKSVGPGGSTIQQTSDYPAIIEARGINPLIEPTKSRPFTCPFRGHMRVDNVDAADRIVKGDVAFSSEYDSIFGGRKSSESDIFTLNISVTPPQWIPGSPLK